ncbi:hypothetical protein PW52_09795 [Tamlana sedimentorum]|uniref:Transglutaminase n=1 Tax=Neotamlana sedimentorum TaxID=1435349 RepID=A0A0D7W8E4_9FLAO|nr:transglutaminase domain-containing protein [Tamlana sedimentorum]KJD35386.1 hypothetical protein PW52_09795 [Tamlana sedimentorum]
MKNLYLIAILIAQITFAQDFKFGKVSKEELQEEKYLQDPSANAVVLYKKQSTYFSFNTVESTLITEIHERIKIYNKDGFDYATHFIDLYQSGNSEEDVSGLKAVTYNLVDGQIEKTSLDKKQIFETEVNYNYNEIKFSMPDVKEGCVIEFKYKITSPFIWNIDEFVLQYDIPIKKVEASISTPDGLNFKETIKGFIPFYGKPGQSYNETRVKEYNLVHVPALKEERFVDNIDNYRAGVVFELKSIIIPGVVHKTYSSSWADVAKTIGNTNDYETQLDKSRSFNDELDPILANVALPTDKMKAVFNYVKNHIKWNNMDGKYFYQGIKKALQEGKGNAADVNLTLVAMLRYAGINANPVVLSTKDNIIPIFPTIDRLNYVIAYAEINGKAYFLDATSEFSDINILPIKDYNWKGIYIDNNNMVWKSIDISKPPIAEELNMLSGTLTEDGAFEGKIRSRYTNHNALLFRKRFKNEDIDAFVAKKEEKLDNIEISNYEAKNTETTEGFVMETFDFKHESIASSVGDKLYVNPILFLKQKENPFKLEKREFPIDFGFPFQDKYNITVKLPEGYVAESVPAPLYLKIPDNLGYFKFKVVVNGSMMQLAASLEINRAMIGPDKYLFLKEFFNQIVIKEEEQVVLTKV